MNKKRLHPEWERETGRIEAFSDGVFAIAVTILVLDIKIPDATPNEGKLMVELIKQWPEYLSYTTSFLVIGGIWANHHNTFKYITKSNNVLLLLNTVYLMCVAFIPYPTDLLSEYIVFEEDGRIASKIYSGTMAVTSIVYGLMCWYATSNHRLIGANVTETTIKKINLMNLLAIVLYIVSFLLSFWSVYFSLAIYFILTLMYIFPNWGSKIKLTRHDT